MVFFFKNFYSLLQKYRIFLIYLLFLRCLSSLPRWIRITRVGANNIFFLLKYFYVLLFSFLIFYYFQEGIYQIKYFFINNNESWLFCNDYLDKYACQFKNPHTDSMVGIYIIYNYIQVFLMFGMILVIVGLIESFLSGGIYLFSLHRFKRGWNYPNALKHRENFLLEIYFRLYQNEHRLSHAPSLEFIWTIVPIFLLIFIAWPSFILLYSIETSISPLYTITVTGSQWFWTYEYNNFNLHTIVATLLRSSSFIIEISKTFSDPAIFELTYEKFLRAIFCTIPSKISFDSNLISEDFLPFGYPRLLSTDNVLVLPSKTPLRLLVTSNDVIHSWSVPNFGIKVDAVPGRLNQVFLNTDFCGTSWGQCSELCGVNHGYMPIEVRVLPLEEFLFFIKLKTKEILIESPFGFIFKQIRPIDAIVRPINMLAKNSLL